MFGTWDKLGTPSRTAWSIPQSKNLAHLFDPLFGNKSFIGEGFSRKHEGKLLLDFEGIKLQSVAKDQSNIWIFNGKSGSTKERWTWLNLAEISPVSAANGDASLSYTSSIWGIKRIQKMMVLATVRWVAMIQPECPQERWPWNITLHPNMPPCLLCKSQLFDG